MREWVMMQWSQQWGWAHVLACVRVGHKQTHAPMVLVVEPYGPPVATSVPCMCMT